jgi:hypothetical protein
MVRALAVTRPTRTVHQEDDPAALAARPWRRSEGNTTTTKGRNSAPGNLRADYVLPRKNMQILDATVFWPLNTDPLFPLVGLFPFPSSDHKLVRIDVALPSGND